MSLSRIFAISLGLALAGCTSVALPLSDYCQNDQIIRPSRKDTQRTLNQIAVHNAKWRALCEVK